MKVACIGNMNNNMFALTRYLRDAGIDAHLLLFANELEHFHPASDAVDLSFRQYSHQLTWGHRYEFSSTPKNLIQNDLRDYDVLIGCGTSPAYIFKAGRQLDIFVPYGGDLVSYPFLRAVPPRKIVGHLQFVHAQRQGIRSANYIVMDKANRIYERRYDQLQPKGERLAIAPPMVYLPLYCPERISLLYDRTHWTHEFMAIRQTFDLIVFHHARHCWMNVRKPDYPKGNDYLIRGFAEFSKQHRSVRAGLVLFEYGKDVDKSRQLISSLGIQDKVRWFPRMGRKDLMVGLSLADWGTGEFAYNWTSCGTILETLAMAKPLLHFRDEHPRQVESSDQYPLANARSHDEIASHLTNYVTDRSYYETMGAAGRQWLQQHGVADPVSRIVSALKACA